MSETQPITLPAPFGGINELVPPAALESPFAEKLFNVNVTGIGTEVRHGDSVYAAIGGSFSSGYEVYAFGQYGDSHAWIFGIDLSSGKATIENIDTGSTDYTAASTGSVGLGSSFFFNNYLFFFATGSYSPGFRYNGSGWDVIGYSGTGFNPIAGNSFKTRPYIIQYNSCAYWYGTAGQVTGALTKVDLTSLVSRNTFLTAIASITIADTVAATQLQCFIFSSGEVLFYNGSYPDPSTVTWELVGKAELGQTINYNSGVQYQGDYLMFCDTGIVSLKDVFLRGSDQAQLLSVNSRIQRSWTDLIQKLRTQYSIPNGPLGRIYGVVDQKQNRIIVCMAGYVDDDGNVSLLGSTMFIYSTLYQAWTIHRNFGYLSPFQGLIRYKNKILLAGAYSQSILIYEKEGDDGFTDRAQANDADNTYTFRIKPAPVPIAKAFIQDCQGIEPIIESDLYSSTNYQLVRDLGVQSTTAQTIPDQGSDLIKTFAQIGLRGTYLQLDISGTTAADKTVGYKLYGINFWINKTQGRR